MTKGILLSQCATRPLSPTQCENWTLSFLFGLRVDGLQRVEDVSRCSLFAAIHSRWIPSSPQSRPNAWLSCSPPGCATLKAKPSGPSIGMAPTPRNLGAIIKFLSLSGALDTASVSYIGHLGYLYRLLPEGPVSSCLTSLLSEPCVSACRGTASRSCWTAVLERRSWRCS